MLTIYLCPSSHPRPCKSFEWKAGVELPPPMSSLNFKPFDGSYFSNNRMQFLITTGGRYLTIPEVSNKRTGRGAQLVLPLTPPWNDGNLCLSFRHKLAGHHVGMLQVFVKKGKQDSPAVWGRTGGNGWRHTQITLWGTGLESVSVMKGFK